MVYEMIIDGRYDDVYTTLFVFGSIGIGDMVIWMMIQMKWVIFD